MKMRINTNSKARFPIFVVASQYNRRYRFFLEGERRFGRGLNNTPLCINEWTAFRLCAAFLHHGIPCGSFMFDGNFQKVQLMVADRWGSESPFPEWCADKAGLFRFAETQTPMNKED